MGLSPTPGMNCPGERCVGGGIVDCLTDAGEIAGVARPRGHGAELADQVIGAIQGVVEAKVVLASRNSFGIISGPPIWKLKRSCE